MALAAGRDSIARQYADGFADVFACCAAIAPQVREGHIETAKVQGHQRLDGELVHRV